MIVDDVEAESRLRRMVAASDAPALDDVEISELVDIAKRADHVLRDPSDPAWIPTYDLRAAASEGWRWKAGKVAGGYDFQSEAQSFSRSQIHAHCLEMAAMYNRGSFTAVPVGTPALRLGVVAPVIANIDLDEGL